MSERQTLPAASRWRRVSVGALLLLVALNAMGGGIYGMLGARGVPTEWLSGSPFATYFTPSVVLFFVVGGVSLLAAVAAFFRTRFDRASALAAAAVVLGWVTAQVLIIGFVSWLQPAVAVAGLLIVVLASRPTHNHRPRGRNGSRIF